MMSQVVTTRSAPSVRSGHPRRAAGRDDDDVRRQGDDVGAVRHGPEPEVHAEDPALGRQPVRDADQVLRAAASPAPRGGPGLPARARPPAGRRAWPRSAATRAASRPAGPAPTTTTRFGADRSSAVMTCGIVSSRPVAGLWMHSASSPRYSRLMQYDAPTHGRIRSASPRSSLRTMCGIGHVRPHHPDHVQQPLADGVARRRDVGDPGGVEDRQVHPLAEAPGELERRPERRAHPRDHVGDRLVRGDGALDDVDEVDRPGPGQGRRDLDAVGLGQAARHVLAADHPDTDDEVVADGAPDRLEDLDREAHPVRRASRRSGPRAC